MADISKIKALAAQQAATGRDVSVQGGGDFEAPAAGVTRLRFIEYIELGVHTKESRLYGPKTKPRAQFGFELSGPRHPPKVFEGVEYPHIIRFEEVIGYTGKNAYSKLFAIMSADHPGAKNFAELLGNEYLGTVVHREWEAGGKKRISAELKNANGYQIRSTTYEDQATGQPVTIAVDEPRSPLKVFLWDLADTEQWDDVFIDGTFDDGNTKNKVQEKIKAAENFVGSAIYEALIEAGREAELEPAPVYERGGQAPEQEQQEEGEQEGVQEAQEQAQETSKPAAKATPATAKKTAPAPVKAVAPAKAPAVAAKPQAARPAVRQSAPVKPAAARPAQSKGDPLAGL